MVFLFLKDLSLTFLVLDLVTYPLHFFFFFLRIVFASVAFKVTRDSENYFPVVLYYISCVLKVLTC